MENNEPIWFGEGVETIDLTNKPTMVNPKYKIMVCTPMHSGASIHYVQSMLKYQQACIMKNIVVSFTLLKSSLVQQGRNLCVADFISHKDNYTHLLFIDSDIDFQHKLDEARHIAQPPFKITSGYRCEEHNIKVGGRVGSSHLKGLAADIGYNGSRERYLILNALMQVGINRIGIAKTFIHCDVDNLKDKSVIWLY